MLIICGDAFHNFTDGIALGASMSQSLALGISTAIALVFHEIPHELGELLLHEYAHVFSLFSFVKLTIRGMSRN